MIEIPESRVLSLQAADILAGKTISKVIQATSPHKFTWDNGDPKEYEKIIKGKQITGALGHGSYVDLICEDGVRISYGDGANVRYYLSGEKYPAKHQMQIVFSDDSSIVFTVSMYGAIYVHKSDFKNAYYTGSLQSISPLSDEFNENYFEQLFKSILKSMSVKAFLATEQRIPGLGNGVLHDILFTTGIHPKRKTDTLSDFEKGELFDNMKQILMNMAFKGGRDTEKDLLGNNGRYKTILSKKTYKDPCPNCGNDIIKEAYLGGSIYYCPTCQRL